MEPSAALLDALADARRAGTDFAPAWTAAMERVLSEADGTSPDAPRTARWDTLADGPGSVQRVNAIDEEMDEEAGALSPW